jgi:hypothetical protein
MRTMVAARVFATALILGIAAHAWADVVTDWNTTLLEAVRAMGEWVTDTLLLPLP